MKKRTGKMISLSLAVAMAVTAAPVTALADENTQGSVIEASELTPAQSAGETGTDTTTVDTKEEEGTAWATLTPAEKVEEEAVNALPAEEVVEEETLVETQEAKITVNGEAVDSLADAFAKANADTITTSITIKIPEGQFYATDNEQLKITRNNVFIEGAGQDKTIIDCGNYSCSGQGGILIASEHVYISDLTVLSSANPDNKGNVAAIKATDLSSPSKILNDIYIERVTVSSEFGHGLNLHGTDSTVDGLTVKNAGKCGISLANTSAIVRNTSIKDTVWGDIGMMYADTDDYKNPVKLLLQENNNIDLIYSERTTSDKHDFIRFMANYDGIVLCKPDVEIDYAVDAGVNKPTIIYSGKAAYIEGQEGTTYGTVQDAIDAANPGNTIIVMNGVHKENIIIPENKALTLEGESKNAVIQFDVATKNPVVQGTTTYYPIVYAQSNTTISNLTIAGPTDQHHGIDGVLATADLTMENVTIQDIRCTADGADYCGVQTGRGVLAFGKGDVKISNCVVERFQKNAIDLNTTGNQTITDTIITGAGSQEIIAQNGIVIRQGNATISNCTISDLIYAKNDPWAHGSVAIYPLEGVSVSLDNNTISNTDSGVAMNGSVTGADTTNYEGGIYVNDNWYGVEAALTYLEDGAHVKLNQDITLPVTIDKNNVTIDGAGYSITVESGDALTVTGDHVTLNNVKTESKNGIALVAGSSSDHVAGITVNGGTYKTGTEATGKQGEGALRIYSSEKVTVKDVTTIGGIHLLATNNDYEITGNTIGFTYTGDTAFVGILVMEDKDSQTTAQSLVNDNTISLPNAGSDYAQIVTGGNWGEMEKVTGSTAKIDDAYYNTLEDAVKAVNDNEIITLTKNCNEKITVSRVVTFTLETEGGAEFTGSITAGSGYRLNKDGNVYTFTKRTSSGGGSHRYDGYITIINPKNGEVSVSDNWADEDDKITLTITPDKGYVVDKIEIVDAEGDKIDAKKVEDKDNKYTFRMANCDVTVTVTFKEEGKTTEDTDKEEDKDDETTENTDLNFTDVSSSDWFFKGVEYVVDKGIMSGVSENQFDPSGKLTRAMLVQMLYNMESRPACDTQNAFIDVPVGQWYTDAVIWANDAKIVSGMGEGLFAPNMEITREQMVAMLYNYAKYKGYDVTASADLSTFADSASVSAWAQPAMQWAVAEGYISGMGDNQLAPQGTATRAEIASVIMRFMEATAETAE
ncbi:putative uncharacterized protein [Firmicutes bacterium CAG:466]|nr:putative uncharacterized protein [Firmicutes bacterium CAG:466]